MRPEANGAVRLVVVSAAQPGGETLHMNERPSADWQASDAECRAAAATLDPPPWYAANIHLSARPA